MSNINFTEGTFQKYHAEKFLKARKQIPTQLIAKKRNGTVCVADVSFATDAEKDIVVSAIRVYLRKIDAIEYMIISETWIGGAHGIRPSDSLVKTEGVVYSTWNIQGTNSSCIWEIKRKENGVGYLSDSKDIQSAEVAVPGSIMANLFTPETNRITGTQKRKIDKAVLSLTKKAKIYDRNTSFLY